MLLLLLLICLQTSLQQDLPAGRCDTLKQKNVYTTCTSWAAFPISHCPPGFSKVKGSAGYCTYVLKIGGREHEISGLRPHCRKNYMYPMCCPQHWGPLCLPCPSWSGKTCNFRGTCEDGDQNNGTCVCEENFSGFSCHECKNPNSYGENCDKECDCVHGVCNKGPDGDGQCLCQPPYTGKRCDQVSNRCSSCTQYSYCKGEGDDAYCECLPGYRKSSRNTCTICSQKDCDVNAQCSSQGSKVVCTCKPDYEGDGKVCVPRNPCSENNGGCPVNSTVCVFDGPNKSICKCMFGMSPIGGDPKSGCQLVSACFSDTCHPTATCQTGVDGQPRCVCGESQIGDDYRCYDNLMDRLLQLELSRDHRDNMTLAVSLFGKKIKNTNLNPKSHEWRLWVRILSWWPVLYHSPTLCLQGVNQKVLCQRHIILGHHRYADLTGKAHEMYGGGLLRTKELQKFILLGNPSRVYTVIQKDLPAANGVIHIIDKVIMDRFSDKHISFIYLFFYFLISCILSKDGRYNRFLSLVDNCGSPPPLKGRGPLTVFIPTNEAVDRARDGSILYMLHDVSARPRLTADELSALPQIQTMANQKVVVNVSANGEILLGEKGVRLVTKDIVASNGIIHMIDGLLYPPSILPILPHRCDIVQNKITMGPCVHCSSLHETRCPDGSVEMVMYLNDILFCSILFYSILFNQVEECCKGFYGPDCKPCIGGFKHPCYDKGTCFDGISGNGSCSCQPGLKGIACHLCVDPAKHGDNCDEDCHCVHGVCDSRPGSGGVCRNGSCFEGYSGPNCDKMAMPCNSDGMMEHCHIHAECTYVGPGNVSCVCGEGWTGDGQVCVEINNCQLESRGGCSPNANCNHIGPGQVGGLTLKMNSLLNLVQPVLCRNSECVCKIGYMGDGIICDFIDPCSISNGGCHVTATCAQTEGGAHTCTCPEGLAGDGQTCYGTILEVNTHQYTPQRSQRCASVTLKERKKQNKGKFSVQIKKEVFSVCGQILMLPRSDLPPDPPTLMAFLNTSSNFTLFREYAQVGVCPDGFYTQNCVLSSTYDVSVLFLCSFTTCQDIWDGDVVKYHVLRHGVIFPDTVSDGTLKSTVLGSRYQVQFHRNHSNQVTTTEPAGLDAWAALAVSFKTFLLLTKSLRANFLHLHKVRPEFPVNMRSNCKFRKRAGGRRKTVPGCVMDCTQVTTDHSCCPGYYGHECFKCPGEVGSWCSNHGECQDGHLGNGECRCYEGFHGTACEDCEPGRYGVNCSSKCVCSHGKCDDGLAGSGKCMCYKGWKGSTCSIEIKDDACGGRCDENANRSNGGCSEFATCTKVSAGERTCSCKAGYTGDGVVCLEIDGCLVNNGGCQEFEECVRAGPNICCCCVCVQNNGGCNKYANCEYFGQGQRNCTCHRGYIGDGFDCHGTTDKVRNPTSDFSLTSPHPDSQDDVMSEGPGLYSRGPFTVFSPVEETNETLIQTWNSAGRVTDLTFYHVVSCETLNFTDLKTTERAISVLGHALHFSVREGAVWINNRSRIVKSDYATSNGVIHHIDKLLTPYRLEDKLPIRRDSMNLTTAASFYGYSRFSTLLEVIKKPVSGRCDHPYTVFWPTNEALDSMPAQRWRWLTSPDNNEQLAAIVKAHIIRSYKVDVLIGSKQLIPFGFTASYRTMHGSTIQLSCDKSLVGNLLINGNGARIEERFLNFRVGIAYGIDQLLEPPGLGAHCDDIENKTGRCGRCSVPPSCSFRHIDTGGTVPCFDNGRGRGYSFSRHYRSMGCKRICMSKSWIHKCCKNHYGRDCQVCPGGLEAPCGNKGSCNDGILGLGDCRCNKGSMGTSCERCQRNYYGLNCTACSCGKNGKCDDGVDGSGLCTCNSGWEGDQCQRKVGSIPKECQQCHANALCLTGVGCRCKSGFEGNGTSCTAPDLCAEYNGGCHQNANCSQTGQVVNCTCQSGYQGDGFECEPINRCVEEPNGGCSDFATCTFTGPNERTCECQSGYVGNGVQCLEKAVPPVDRCLEDNGGCDPVASCKDLHYHANTAGVFHLRSPEGKYKMNFSQADAACQAEGATLVSFKQLGDAQQLGMHLCVAGWMEGGKVGYPTRYPSIKCGENHVGLVMYKEPVDQSSKYDAYCYRLNDVSCSCPREFVGNGDFCHGVLTSVLATYNNFSIFYKVSVFCLSFQISNSQRYLEYHISTNHSNRLYSDLRHQETIASRLGFNLTVTADSSENRKLVNKRLLVEWDIPAVNGIIHVIEAPLTAPPPPSAAFIPITSDRSAALTILVTVLLACVLAAVGYYLLKHKNDNFRFRYFKNDSPGGRNKPTLVSIPNPLYNASRAFNEPFGVSQQSTDRSGSAPLGITNT
uniref:Stabilin 1 n=1 Tax=Salarias fasciatus TaxID=181472 RepID=A0A672IHS7_SALFA